MSKPHLSMPDERLDVESLHLWRGDRHVLRGVCFSLASGECLQVTGPNGSGKTSLLRTVCGLMYPEAGRVLWEGRDVRSDLRTFHCALVYLGHEPPLKADLSARAPQRSRCRASESRGKPHRRFGHEARKMIRPPNYAITDSKCSQARRGQYT